MSFLQYVYMVIFSYISRNAERDFWFKFYTLVYLHWNNLFKENQQKQTNGTTLAMHISLNPLSSEGKSEFSATDVYSDTDSELRLIWAVKYACFSGLSFKNKGMSCSQHWQYGENTWKTVLYISIPAVIPRDPRELQ